MEIGFAEAPAQAFIEEEKMKTKTSYRPRLHHTCWSNSAIFILQKTKEKVFCQENLTKVSQEKLTKLAYHIVNFIYISALFFTRKW